MEPLGKKSCCTHKAWAPDEWLGIGGHQADLAGWLKVTSSGLLRPLRGLTKTPKDKQGRPSQEQQRQHKLNAAVQVQGSSNHVVQQWTTISKKGNTAVGKALPCRVVTQGDVVCALYNRQPGTIPCLHFADVSA